MDSVIRIDSRMERVGKWKRSKVMKKRGEEKDYEKKEELVLKGKQGSNESCCW